MGPVTCLSLVVGRALALQMWLTEGGSRAGWCQMRSALHGCKIHDVLVGWLALGEAKKSGS